MRQISYAVQFLMLVFSSSFCQDEKNIINLRVKSLPESALVYVNDSLLGFTPLEVLRSAGNCILTVSRPGFFTVTKEIMLDPKNNSYNFRLAPLPVSDEVAAEQRGRSFILSGIFTSVLAGVWFIQGRMRQNSSLAESNDLLLANYQARSSFYQEISLVFAGTSIGLFAAGLGKKYFTKN
jgi:hypothetical protein